MEAQAAGASFHNLKEAAAPSMFSDEEIFLSQLARRAKVLNDGFQQKVLEVIRGHAILRTEGSFSLQRPALYRQMGPARLLRPKSPNDSLQLSADLAMFCNDIRCRPLS
jgi:hypothetical protein